MVDDNILLQDKKFQAGFRRKNTFFYLHWFSQGSKQDYYKITVFQRKEKKDTASKKEKQRQQKYFGNKINFNLFIKNIIFYKL